MKQGPRCTGIPVNSLGNPKQKSLEGLFYSLTQTKNKSMNLFFNSFAYSCHPEHQRRTRAGLKLLLIMKLTAIFIFIASLSVSAKGFSQNVTLSEKNAKLEKVFKSIKEQTGYVFFYDQSLINEAKPVTIQVKDASLETALGICFHDQPLTYSIVGTTIVVKQKSSSLTSDHSLLTASTPPIDVKGRIVNENGEPVIATVAVKGTNRAVSTDEDGYFTIKGVDENATLIFSGVNIVTYELKLNGQADISVTVKNKVSKLDEIQVKGYYNTTHRYNTGDVTTVKSSEIEKQPVTNVLSALQGRVTGMDIREGTGVPGGNIKVLIRGQKSIAQGNDPLYIIDGVPYNSQLLPVVGTSIINSGNPLNFLNPSDIESIDILKDVDATAIYGSRGVNGVVLITTKRGKTGTAKIDLMLYSGFGKVTRKLDLLNTQEYVQMRHQAFINDNATPGPTAFDINGVWDSTRYTDWQKTLIGNTAHYTNAEVSFSGGSQNVQYLVSSGFQKETTVFPGDFNDKKASVHFSLNANSNNRKFNMLLTGSYLNDDNNLFYSDLTNVMLNIPPNVPPLPKPFV